MKILLSCILFALFVIRSFGQNGYFATDTLTKAGITLIDGGRITNSRICQIKEKNRIISYTPYQIQEYGFLDGRVYLSKEVRVSDSTERVFMERLAKGKTSLFYYRDRRIKTFYIERDSSLLSGKAYLVGGYGVYKTSFVIGDKAYIAALQSSYAGEAPLLFRYGE